MRMLDDIVSLKSERVDGVGQCIGERQAEYGVRRSTPERFSLGRVVATPGALRALEEAGENPADFLERHLRGDWGEVCADDAQSNDLALKNGARLLSAYRTRRGERLWIITEADRSSTCLLLPEEY